MDLQSVFNMGIGIAFTVTGWFARELWAAVKELKMDLAKLREELPKEYIPKNDFKDFANEIKTLLMSINNKIDHKADKT